MTYHHTSIRITQIKIDGPCQELVRTWSNWNSPMLLVRLQNGTTLGKTVEQFFIKLNIPLTIYPATPLLGIYPSEVKTYIPIET